MDNDPFQMEKKPATFGDLPEAWYPARVAGMVYLGTQVLSYNNRTRANKQFCFVFELSVPNLPGMITDHPILHAIAVNRDASPQSKLMKVLGALGLYDPNSDSVPSVAPVPGRTCRVLVKRNNRGFNFIERIDKLPAEVNISSWKAKPFAINPIQEAKEKPWQLVYDNLKTHPYLPQLFGDSIADVVAASEELALYKPHRLQRDSGYTPEADDEGVPF